MRPAERTRLERRMLRMALDAAREALQAFPGDSVGAMPDGPVKAKLIVWRDAIRNVAICELSTIIGDVPVAQLDPRHPPRFERDPDFAKKRELLNALKRQLGVPVL